MNNLLRYKSYTASINFSTADDVFYGKILGISDLVSFEGLSIKELKSTIKEAVDDYLDLYNEIGNSPNLP